MTEEKGVREGGCRCGRVRFQVSAPPLLTMACHCKGCQRMTGGAFSLSDAIAGESFALIQGETAIGGLRAVPEHHFCGWCMSWLFTRLPPEIGNFVNVRSTMMDRPVEEPPFIEAWTSVKLPGIATGAVYSYDEFPPSEAYAGLAAEFAQRFSTR
ncbi:MAG: GFA family protein [Amphiplicatus sp.]